MATNYFSQPPLREKLCKVKTTLLQHLCIRIVFCWIANWLISPFKEKRRVFSFWNISLCQRKIFAAQRSATRPRARILFKRFVFNDGRLIPFMPSKVTWSFSAKEIQENLTLSTENNVFITFQVSFKSVNRGGNKQFTPSCGSSLLETNPVFYHVWKRSYHRLSRKHSQFFLLVNFNHPLNWSVVKKEIESFSSNKQLNARSITNTGSG